jgi:hypothetical protein
VTTDAEAEEYSLVEIEPPILRPVAGNQFVLQQVVIASSAPGGSPVQSEDLEIEVRVFRLFTAYEERCVIRNDEMELIGSARIGTKYCS